MLRVSSHAGLEALSISVSSSTSRNLLDLVYQPGYAVFSRVEPRADSWFLAFKAEHPGAAKELLHASLVAARDVPGGVEVKLSTSARPALEDFYVDDGPYRQVSFSGDKLVLERRAPGVPQRIEVYAMSSESEECRRFLAREVDVVPRAEAGQARQLREVPSVRVVPVEHPSTAAIFFNVRRGAFATAEARRLVSAGFRRRAIAHAATSDDTAAVGSDVEKPSGEERPSARGRVRLLFYAGASDTQRAALVIEQQLLELGFQVDILALDLPELGKQLSDGGYDLFLHQGAYEPAAFKLATSASDYNLTGYANPEFDAAVAAGNDARALELLARDVPFAPLYGLREAVALDVKLCGDRPKYSYDLSWLATVHTCAPGERE